MRIILKTMDLISGSYIILSFLFVSFPYPLGKEKADISTLLVELNIFFLSHAAGRSIPPIVDDTADFFMRIFPHPFILYRL